MSNAKQHLDDGRGTPVCKRLSCKHVTERATFAWFAARYPSQTCAQCARALANLEERERAQRERESNEWPFARRQA